MDCKMQVSVGQQPPCDHPSPLPCPVVLRQESPLGFPRGWSLFCCCWESWSSCFRLSGPHPGQPPYWKQGGPQDVLLSVETSSGPGGEASGCATLTHLCLSAWHCAFSGELASSLRGQATRGRPGAHSQAFWVTAGGLVDRRGKLWPSS